MSPDDTGETPVINIQAVWWRYRLKLNEAADNLRKRADLLRQEYIDPEHRKRKAIARLLLDCKQAKDCDDVATEVRRLARRTKSWPDMTSASIRGEKQYIDKEWDKLKRLVDILLAA